MQWGSAAGSSGNAKGIGPRRQALRQSNLRPNCLAKDRIFEWKGTRVRSLFDGVPDRLKQTIVLRLHNTWEKSTLRSYGAGLLKYQRFCDELDIPEQDRLPASDAIILGFIAWVGGLSKEEVARDDPVGASRNQAVDERTISSYLSGLRAWHIANGFSWEDRTRGEMADAMRKAVRRIQGLDHRKVPRRPVTLKMLKVLRDDLNLDEPFDSAVWAQATAMFWGLLRMGEAAPSSQESFDERKQSSRGHVKVVRDDEGKAFFTIEIPWAKTARPGESQFATLIQQKDPLCPVAAMAHHMATSRLSDDKPLFAYAAVRDGRVGWKAMTRSDFLNHVNRAWVKAGLGSLSGHCFRIGGASCYMARGVAVEVIRQQGRWKSDAFLLYIRHWELIFPVHLADPELQAEFAGGGEAQLKEGTGSICPPAARVPWRGKWVKVSKMKAL